MVKPTIQWQTAKPLWSLALEDKDARHTRFRQPSLLRFDADTFMEDVQQTLDTRPGRLEDYVVRYETWRKPGVGWLKPSDSGWGSMPSGLWVRIIVP